QEVLDRAGFPRGSHDYKALNEIIDTFPRDELFQMHADELYEVARGILELGERQRVRLFLRADRYERFVSCLVYIPRDRFNTANRLRIGGLLSDALEAKIVEATRSWDDELQAVLTEEAGEEAGTALFRRYGGTAFPVAYRGDLH